jgi:hypothetical protein
LRTAGAGLAGENEGMWLGCGRRGREFGAGRGAGRGGRGVGGREWANWHGMAWTPVARRAEVGPRRECVGERRVERELRGEPRSIG